jgi:iron-sulfur cluster repair protein YtfE (RIC family)
VTESRRDTLPEHDFVSHEHRELGRGIDRIHEVGALRGTNEELSVAALAVLHWTDTVLEPHARWEDRWLYPEIARRAGTPWATKLMSFEHQQIREAARLLARARAQLHDAPTDALVIEVRARLFAFEAILRAHMAREERFLIPLLEAGMPNDAGAAPPPAEVRTSGSRRGSRQEGKGEYCDDRP